MRGARLFLFTSLDGRTFVPAPNAPIEAAQLAPGNMGLFDPTLVQLPDGRIFMYVTAGNSPSGGGQRVVRAELVAVQPTTVRNAASFQNGIAPGSIVSIFGNNLATATDAATRFPLPLELAGASVRINGIAAPLLYASPGQINAQVPYELKTGSAFQVPHRRTKPTAFQDRTAHLRCHWRQGRDHSILGADPGLRRPGTDEFSRSRPAGR